MENYMANISQELGRLKLANLLYIDNLILIISR